MAGGWKVTNTDTIVNQTNNGGGVKKQGLPSTVGLDASVSGVYRKKVGCLCPSAYDFINTTRTCGAGVGSIRTPRC